MFVYSVVEQPYKIPHYAALLRDLYEPSPALSTEEENGSSSTNDVSLGRQILDDYWKGFQAYLDKHAWREVRFCVSIEVLYSSSRPPLMICYLLSGAFLCTSHCSWGYLPPVSVEPLTIIHCRPR